MMQKPTKTLILCLAFFLLASPALAEDAGVADDGGVAEDGGAAREAGAEDPEEAETEEEEEAEAQDMGRQVSGEELYRDLSELARRGGHSGLIFRELSSRSHELDWSRARDVSFVGNVRQLEVIRDEGEEPLGFYLVREESGDIYILYMPEEVESLDDDSPYAGLADAVGNKVTIQAQMLVASVDGVEYRYVKFTEKPARLLLDRLFFIAIVILLFLTMVGMGLTLTLRDFALVFKKPMGIVIGLICQFGLLPLLAMVIGRVVGYYETYPFIFLGLILIASSPGGVTSNLMTYLGKGDLALSVSLTAVCTILALFFTPFLLTVYGGNIPNFSIPVEDVFKQMLILVIVPLFVGMMIRWRAEAFAKRAEKIFALIGIFSLLFLIAVGILGNLEKFGDTERYGVKFYIVTFVLTLAGMLVAGFIAKVLKISNFQVRAISIECGLRNASLAMTIAILIQDRMGDFYSSMLFTSGIFGLWMYLAGTISIFTFRKWLPVSKEDLEELEKAKEKGGKKLKDGKEDKKSKDDKKKKKK